MKRILSSALALWLCLAFSVCLISCNDVEKTGIWESATYLNDTTVGNGDKEVKVIISGEDQSVTLTVKTDKDTLGEALHELELINNDNGLFDTVIGMQADYAKNQAFWAFYDVNDNYMNSGVFDTEISGGETYKFVYKIGF